MKAKEWIDRNVLFETKKSKKYTKCPENVQDVSQNYRKEVYTGSLLFHHLIHFFVIALMTYSSIYPAKYLMLSLNFPCECITSQTIFGMFANATN